MNHHLQTATFHKAAHLSRTQSQIETVLKQSHVGLENDELYSPTYYKRMESSFLNC